MSAQGRRADGGRPGWTPAPVRGQGGGMTDERQRTPVQALFRRVIVINGLVFTIGTLVLALSPATVSSPVLLTEVPVLSIGLALMLGANTLLLRRSLAPLEALTALMRRVDVLRPSDRLTDKGNGDL